MDGLARKPALPPAAEAPYEAKADMLPTTLGDALRALRSDDVLCGAFGQGFIDYYCRIKEAEIARFNLEVSEWEHREYFDLF
jgi:glutamine synthetase